MNKQAEMTELRTMGERARKPHDDPYEPLPDASVTRWLNYYGKARDGAAYRALREVRDKRLPEQSEQPEPSWVILEDSLQGTVVPDVAVCLRCGVVSAYVDVWHGRCPVCAILDTFDLWPKGTPDG